MNLNLKYYLKYKIFLLYALYNETYRFSIEKNYSINNGWKFKT